MEPAEHDRDACFTIAISDRVGLVDLRGERGDPDEIERFQRCVRIKVLNLAIGDLDVVGCQRRHRQQPQAGQRSHDLAAADELRKCDA